MFSSVQCCRYTDSRLNCGGVTQGNGYLLPKHRHDTLNYPVPFTEERLDFFLMDTKMDIESPGAIHSREIGFLLGGYQDGH